MWNKDMSAAPKDRPILVRYDHAADPYEMPDENKLTDYACHAEGGDFYSGQGVCIAAWCEGYWESEGWESTIPDYYMPAWWRAWVDDDFGDQVVNPVAWIDIPEYRS